MRQVFINRTRSSEYGTFGELRIDDIEADAICATCELPWHDNHPQTSCIPVGTYVFNIYNSPKHGPTWMTSNVPGRSYIEIHAANWPSELLGCIGVGEDYVEDMGGRPGVNNSQTTLKSLRAMLPNTIQVTITENLT